VISTLLIDVDGVLQFGSPEFAAAMESEYKWRHGYMAFQHALLHDPAGKKALLGDGDILDVISKEIPGHVDGLKPRVFFDRWLNENVAVNEALIALLPQVKVDSIYIVTNQEPHRAARIKALYGKKSWISGFVISSEIGYAKPDPEFFRAALERIGKSAHECLLIDDNARYVEGAAKVGVRGILFRGNPQLIKELTELGLLSVARRPA
jgi:HAD superfamily hydrolase (TIGR01509 family)